MSVFLAGLFATLACAACFGAFWVTYNIQIAWYSREDRIQTVEDNIQSLRGKLSASDRWSRDEIRDAVDTYLQQMDLEPGGGGMEDFLPMLMQMQMSQAPATGEQSGTPGDGAASDVDIARFLSGKGGVNDG